MAVDDSEWPYRLAQALLDAAVSCGAECARRYVTDGPLPEGMPPDCPCQLVAVVTEGFARRNDNDPCSLVALVDVRLVLDLCVPVPGKDESPDPVLESTQARANARTRWLMQKGLRLAVVTPGTLPGRTDDPDDPMPPGVGSGCANVRAAPWTSTLRQGGMARWETTWRIFE